MRIDKKLNLVIPIYGDDSDAPTAWVHSTPIRRETFERYHMVIAKTFASIYTEGLDFRVGPRVAMLRLREIAEEMKRWEGPTGVEAGLVAEMRRLTNLITPQQDGALPWQVAIDKGMIDPDDKSEVENAIAFFTVVSHMHRHHELKAILEGVAVIWSAQITSSTCMEYLNSLKTSTAAANTGEMPQPSLAAAPSSIPS
jgi:hypothetical protein